MGFERCHPAVNLIYFTAVIGGTVCFRHPVYLAISLCSAFLYSVKRKGRRAVAFGLCLVPLVVALGLFTAAIIILVTNLRQNFIGNQITLESLVYGLALGCTLAGVAMWMSCVYAVFSADKVVYLLGESAPDCPCFYPCFFVWYRKCGCRPGKSTWHSRALAGGSVRGTYCEGSQMAFGSFPYSSPDGGGPGCRIRIHAEPGQWTKGRTAFSIYRFDNRDRGFVMGLFTCLTVVWMGGFTGPNQDAVQSQNYDEPGYPGILGILLGRMPCYVSCLSVWRCGQSIASTGPGECCCKRQWTERVVL